MNNTKICACFNKCPIISRSACHKNNTVVPLFLIINDLPINIRFIIRNSLFILHILPSHRCQAQIRQPQPILLDVFWSHMHRHYPIQQFSLDIFLLGLLESFATDMGSLHSSACLVTSLRCRGNIKHISHVL